MQKTELQVEVEKKIGGRKLVELSQESSLDNSTLSRVRRGHWRARGGVVADRLALWLGWSVERVLEAAGRPAEVCGCCGRVPS